MEVLLLLGLLIVLGTLISLFSKPFRRYWLFSLVAATVLAFLYQIIAFFEAGFLDPFYQIAFVVSWVLFFGIASACYFGYRLIMKKRAGQNAAAPSQ